MKYKFTLDKHSLLFSLEWSVIFGIVAFLLVWLIIPAQLDYEQTNIVLTNERLFNASLLGALMMFGMFMVLFECVFKFISLTQQESEKR